MYVPKIFSPPSLTAVQKYIEENGFATLCSLHKGSIIATHTPLYIELRDDKEYLVGHISAANEQRTSIEEGQEMLAIFMEHHTYISSSWYDHVNVPTWNYIGVHISGNAHILDEESKLKAVHTIVEKYESGNKDRFRISDMTERDLKAQLSGIVAFEMEVSRIEASWKLSQNRSDKDYQNIIEKLMTRGDDLSVRIAEHMQNMR